MNFNINTEIRCYLYDLVSSKKICYSHLNQEEKETLTALIIKSSKPLTAHEFVTEADKGDQLPYLLASYMLSKNYGDKYKEEKSDNLINYMAESAVKHAEITIDEMLENINEQFEFDKKFYKDEEE